MSLSAKMELKKSLKYWNQQLRIIEGSISRETQNKTLKELLENKREEYKDIIKTITKQMSEPDEKTKT